jgi:hypothetical protein
MMNRSFLLRMLRRPKAGLRKRSSMTIDPASAAAADNGGAGADAPAVAGAAAGAARVRRGAPRGPETMDEVSKEIAILKKLDHPNVVKLYEVIDPPGSQYMMLVMEYLEKGPVLQTRDQAGFDRLPEEVRRGAARGGGEGVLAARGGRGAGTGAAPCPPARRRRGRRAPALLRPPADAPSSRLVSPPRHRWPRTTSARP